MAQQDGLEPKNALWRRDEQLKRWNQSETNKESGEPKHRDKVKVNFQDGCVFLAACASGDREEVERLLERGADINTGNIDGLTALHQACIDDNLEMVAFLVSQKADIDACDNEGWTALHATASCGLLEIAKYLLEQGANVAAVNNDGELAIDISEDDEMEQMLYDDMVEKDVDAEAARSEEEKVMLNDALKWLNDKSDPDQTHPKTGATAMHVAAAKGYEKVMNILLQAGCDINKQDLDGWTPLHAAAHWDQEDASKLLVENFCKMDVKNDSHQTAFDVADKDLKPFLQQLKLKQESMAKDKEAKKEKDTVVSRTGTAPLKRRSSVTRMSIDQKQNILTRSSEDERAHIEASLRGSIAESDEIATSNTGNGVTNSVKPTAEIDTAKPTIPLAKEDESLSSDSSTSSPSSVESSDDSGSSETQRQNEINSRKTADKATNDLDHNQESIPVALIGDKPSETHDRMPRKTHEQNTDKSDKLISPPLKLPTSSPDSKATDTTPSPPLRSLSDVNRPSSSDVSDTKNSSSVLSQMKDDIKRTNSFNTPTTSNGDDVSSNSSVLNSSKDDRLSRSSSLGDNHVKMDAYTSWRQQRHTDEQNSQWPHPSTVSMTTPHPTITTTAPTNVNPTKNTTQVPDIGTGVNNYNKYSLGRTTSAPTVQQKYTFGGLGKHSLGLSYLNRGVRKTGSSSAVPDLTSSVTRNEDQLARSASSPWLAPDKRTEDISRRGRPVSASSLCDSQEARNRFNDFYSRYTSLLGTSTSTSTSTRSIVTPSSTTSSSTSTRPTSTLSSSSSILPPQSTYQKSTWRRTSSIENDNTSTGNRRSFEPPKRDEERETERKAKAKKARETRRSTQGVTKEDLERAELTLQAAKDGKDPPDIHKLASTTASTTDDKSDKENSKPDDYSSSTLTRHKYAWDDKKDDDYKSSRRTVRDLGLSTDTTTSGYLRSLRTSGSLTSMPSSTLGTNSSGTNNSALVNSLTDSTTTTSSPAFRQSYRSPYLRSDDSTDKHDDNNEKDDASQKSQSAAIRSRRKRENRRPTGKITAEDLQGVIADEKKEEKKDDSRTSSSSRYGMSRFSDPTGSIYGKPPTSPYLGRSDRSGSYSSTGYTRSHSSLSDKDADYKMLYEDEKQENDRLRQDVKKLQIESSKSRLEIEKMKMKNERPSEATAEKRERRLLERKLAEMEEELKAMEALKNDNQRLKDENGALIRVISKLSK